MESQYDNVILRFEGDRLTPASVGRELISLIDCCYELAASVDDGNVGIESISQNCISIKILASALAICAMTSCNCAIDDVPKFNQAAKSLNGFLARHSATMDVVNGRSNVLARYSANSPIQERKDETVRWHSRISVYGELLDIGGNAPNVHIQMRKDDKPVVLGIDKENARRISSRLYTDIGVVADVIMRDDKILSGNVVELLDYAPDPWDEWQKKMAGIIGDAFMNESVENFIERVRG